MRSLSSHNKINIYKQKTPVAGNERQYGMVCVCLAVQILACVLYPDLQVQRDCAFALANISDSVEFQNDVVREGGIEVLVRAY